MATRCSPLNFSGIGFPPKLRVKNLMLFQIDIHFEEKYIQLKVQLVVAESRRTRPGIIYSAEMQWRRVLMKWGFNFYFAGHLKPNSKALIFPTSILKRADF
jgi:hypothetical protein